MDFSAVKELESRLGFKTNKQNLCFTHGEGNTLFGMDGRAYLDLSCAGGESCLGYSHSRLTSAIAAQAQSLITAPSEYYNQASGRVLSRLVDGTGFTKACHFGSAVDSVAAALGMALRYQKDNGEGRKKVVIATGQEQHAGGNQQYAYIEFNNFDALKKSLTPDTAVLALSPMTANGIKIAEYDYLVNAYALCKSMGIVLFCDETRIGFGRTGKRFAFEHYGVQPDIVCVSRALAGGLPIGAMLTRDIFAGSFRPALRSGASQLSLAASEVVLDELAGGLLAQVCEQGEYLMSALYKLTKYNFVLDVRGKGLLAGIELSGRIVAAKVVSQMEKLGFLLSLCDGNIIRFSPSYNISREEIDSAVTALAELFSSTNI